MRHVFVFWRNAPSQKKLRETTPKMRHFRAIAPNMDTLATGHCCCAVAKQTQRRYAGARRGARYCSSAYICKIHRWAWEGKGELPPVTPEKMIPPPMDKLLFKLLL